MTSPNDNVTYAYEADETLKKMLGGDDGLKQIFSAEKIRRCQQLIEDARKDFFITTQSIVDKLNEFAKNPSNDTNIVLRLTGIIQEQSDALRYPFISNICSHILDLCETDHMTERHHLLLRELIGTMQLAFKQKIVDDGGETGKKIMGTLDIISEQASSLKQAGGKA